MKFWKMHGLGNDYIVIDNRNEKISDTKAAELAQKLCERRFSVGADGLLLVSNSSLADVKMRIFNADVSEAEMCGNKVLLRKQHRQKERVNRGNIGWHKTDMADRGRQHGYIHNG
jgi:diaminopimelate epimerase